MAASDILINIVALALFLFVSVTGGLVLYAGIQAKKKQQPWDEEKHATKTVGVGGTLLGVGVCLVIMTVLKFTSRGRIIFCES